MKSMYMQRTVKPGRGRVARSITLPAPINGLVTSESVLSEVQASAVQLDNFFPTRRGVKLRAGTKTVASISTVGDPVQSLISYNSASTKKIFAASTTQIFDVTSVGSPTVPPAAAVSSQTSGYYSYVNFTTTGGQFMTVVNGTNPLLLYDPVGGWKQITAASTPAITGQPTQDLEQVWVYRNRQFFIQARSLIARYLPVGAIAGALGTIDMNGVFQNGGVLVFGATWSMDAGDGLDDKCIFVTDQGEVAIYEGSDPSSISTWNLVGRYEITPPMGKRGTMRLGGELAIATEEGLVPISSAVSKEDAAINAAALSRNIEPDWRSEVLARRALPWEVVKVPRQGYAIVSLPKTTAGQDAIAFVVNTETGKWCRYTNFDARCMVLHSDRLYFGTSDGRVKVADIGGNDDGAGIYYTCVANPNGLGDPSLLKTILMARGTFTSSTPYEPSISVSMDYTIELPSPPASAADVSSSAWDEGTWDTALWDAAAAAPMTKSQWVSIGRTGSVMQYQLQITGALTPIPNTEFVTIDILYEDGGLGT